MNKKPEQGKATRILDMAKSGIRAAYGFYRDIRDIKYQIDNPSDPHHLSGRYQAARPTRLDEFWYPITKNINTLVATEAPIIRVRVQQLVRDFPFFARACKVMVNYTVGTGITYHPMILDNNGRLNTKLNSALEDAWSFWGDEIDPQGMLDVYGMQALAKRQEVESGEFICVLTRSNNPNRYLPIGLRFYESDYLTSRYARDAQGNLLWDASSGIIPPNIPTAILSGVEYNTITGEVLAYHLADPHGYTVLPPVRVPAQYVAHGFDVLRPNQKRGISCFVTAILIAHSLGEIMNAELDAQQMAAKWLAFIETADAQGFQQMRQIQTNSKYPEKNQKIQYIQNAIVEYLRPGEKMNFSASNRPGTNFEPFVKLILRMIAIVTDQSYEILSGDYSGLSYSNLKAIRNDMIEAYDSIQNRHIFQFCKPVQKWFLDTLFLSGKVPMPGYVQNPAPYFKAFWQSAGHRSIDPLREGKANTEAMKTLVMSPQEVCRARGKDLDDVLAEFSVAQKKAEALGIDLFQILALSANAIASNSNNPAALGAGEMTNKSDVKGAKLYAV